MRLLKPIYFLSAIAFVTAMLPSCSDKKSYADLLNDENHAVNYFLSNHRVVNEIPSDTVFECGPDAPYYKLDDDGNLYMQVLNPGTKTNKVEAGDVVYFRYMRYNLTYFMDKGIWYGEGNANDMVQSPTSFVFDNYTVSSSTNYGAGVQMPLHYLGLDCDVNIVIRSQYGLNAEIASVQPFMYNIRYFRSPL